MTSESERGGTRYGCIYLLANTVNGKIYVGQTTLTLDARWKSHRHAMTNPRRKQPITAALRKYGPEAFRREVLAYADGQEELDAAEKEWAERLGSFAPSGYNLRAGNGPGALSEQARAAARERMTPELRDHLRQLRKGQRLPDLAYERARASLSRTVTLLSPSGELTTITNLALFARESGLQGSLLGQVATGVRASHRGWRLDNITAEEISAVNLGDGLFRCPSCTDVWESPDQRRADRHATSCNEIKRRLAVAVSRGHISADAYLAKSSASTWAPKRKVPRAVNSRVMWTVMSPEGLVYEVGNMRRFCSLHGLSAPDMSELVNGKRAAYSGWTFVGSTPSPSTSPACAAPGLNHLGQILMARRAELVSRGTP